tara:strand:+ start:271 stop:642 length:372 start_codon:yes stop_codon:yes gene_type:complete
MSNDLINQYIGRINYNHTRLKQAKQTVIDMERMCQTRQTDLETEVHREFGEFVEDQLSELSQRPTEWTVTYILNPKAQIVINITQVGNNPILDSNEIPDYLKPLDSFGRENIIVPVKITYSPL